MSSCRFELAHLCGLHHVPCHWSLTSSQPSGGSLCRFHGISRPLLTPGLCQSAQPWRELLRRSFQDSDVPSPSFPLPTRSPSQRPVRHRSTYWHKLPHLVGPGCSTGLKKDLGIVGKLKSSLVQDQEGLVVSSPSGRWTRVPNIPGLIVVNTGELLRQVLNWLFLFVFSYELLRQNEILLFLVNFLRQWANDCVSSTPHFVVNLSEKSRWENGFSSLRAQIPPGSACHSSSTAPQPMWWPASPPAPQRRDHLGIRRSASCNPRGLCRESETGWGS